jgi:hypothetical protein
MAVPYLKRADTGAFISDQVVSWTGWNPPRTIVRQTPLAGGAYLQKTAGGVLQCQVVLAFATQYPNAQIDNFFLMCELMAEVSEGEGFLFEFLDLEGFTRDVWIWQTPAGMGVEGTQDLMRFWHPLHSHYAIPVDLMVPGYLP